jgi:hypothetical protein
MAASKADCSPAKADAGEDNSNTPNAMTAIPRFMANSVFKNEDGF